MLGQADRLHGRKPKVTSIWLSVRVILDSIGSPGGGVPVVMPRSAA